RQQAGRLGKSLRRLLERGLELTARRREVEGERARARLETLEQRIGVEAIARLSGDATGRGVWMREEPEALEVRELGPNGGRRHGHPCAHDEALRAHGLAAFDVLLDDAPQDLCLALRQRCSCLSHLSAGNFRRATPR